MKSHTVHRCSECGAATPRWSGRCATCGAWNSLVEERVESTKTSTFGAAPSTLHPAPVALSAVSEHAAMPVPTGIAEFDRALGGGLVPSSVTLLSGEPGVGKSTLVLQIAAGAIAQGNRALIVSGEESAEQLRRRADRLSVPTGDIGILATTSLAAVAAAMASYEPAVLVIDSIQTLVDDTASGSAGSVTQVRECAASLIALTKAAQTATILIGHVTKEGNLAGPRVLEHLVDTVCSFDGDRHHAARVLSVTKHRFGPAGELGIFEMTGEGLMGVDDPSEFLLADRHEGIAGSIVVPAIEGVRPLLVEIQALVVPSALATPRRVAQGLSPGRLSLVAAVLERRVGLRLSASDIFVSIIGGVRVSEPATDLGLALSLASALSGASFGDDLVALGEIGLGGELRQAVHTDRRLLEAERHGFRRAVVPMSAPDGPPGVTLIRAATLRQAIGLLEAPTSVGAGGF